MIALGEYIEYETSKVVGYDIIDEKTFTMRHFEYEELKQLVKIGRLNIINLEIKGNGRLGYINMNPVVRVKYYASTARVTDTVNSYAYITEYANGLISFIAHSCHDSGIIAGNKVTVNEAARVLGVNIKDLVFYNGYVNKDRERDIIHIYRGDGVYRKLRIMEFKTENRIDNGKWEIEIDTATSEGILANKIRGRQLEKESLPYALLGVKRFNGGVKDLVVESNIRKLGKGVFSYLQDLRTLEVASTTVKLPDRCCMESQVERVYLHKHILMIGERAFKGCKKLKKVINKVEVVGVEGFMGSLIEEIELLSIKGIYEGAFRDCKKLERVQLGDNLKAIGDNAFANCISLKEINIPSNTLQIGNGVFRDCRKLERVQLGSNLNETDNNLKEIGDSAFANCISLKEIEIPSSTIKIGNEAFKDCKRLERVQLGDNIREIGDNAFVNCISLKEIYITSNAIKLGNGVFKGCKRLRKVYLSEGVLLGTEAIPSKVQIEYI